MSTLYGIQDLQIPSLKCRFEKSAKDKTISHNIINHSVFFDVFTNAPKDRKETCKLPFRKKMYNELVEESLQNYYVFQNKAEDLEDSKKRLEHRKQLLVQRIKNFEPFINENNDRYRRTHEFAKTDKKIAKVRKEELARISEEIAFLSSRKSFFLKANTQLKRYENFLLETLSLLPVDYVKGLKENNMTALLRRCDALFFMNRATYEDLYNSSNMIRTLKMTLDQCYADVSSVQTEQSLIFPKLQHTAIRFQDELSRKITSYAESYSVLRKKMHTFGIQLQAVNNVTNKCFQMINQGYFGLRDITVLSNVTMMDPNLKFTKMEEYISSSFQILNIVKENRSDLS